jgi:hypothetical protein
VVLMAEPRFVAPPVEPRFGVPMAEPRFVALPAEPRFALPMARPPCVLLMAAEQSMCAVSGRGPPLHITALS